jgi:hypothetical protein
MTGDDVVFLNTPGGGDPGVALKERGASALERALAFVSNNGDELSQTSAFVALRAEPAVGLAGAVGPLQQEDGSFEPFAPPSSGWLGRELRSRGLPARLSGTVEGLSLLCDARQGEAACVESAIRFLERQQLDDGSFAAASFEESTRIVATGVVGGSLARSRFARPEVLSAAATWLGERFSPEAVEAGHPAERAAFAMFYANVPDDLSDEILQWCGRELERGFRTHAAEALAVVQVLLASEVGSLPGASFAPEELLERLLEEQGADGGFDVLSPDGAPVRVGATVDAMRAIIGLCATF